MPPSRRPPPRVTLARLLPSSRSFGRACHCSCSSEHLHRSASPVTWRPSDRCPSLNNSTAVGELRACPRVRGGLSARPGRELIDIGGGFLLRGALASKDADHLRRVCGGGGRGQGGTGVTGGGTGRGEPAASEAGSATPSLTCLCDVGGEHRPNDAADAPLIARGAHRHLRGAGEAVCWDCGEVAPVAPSDSPWGRGGAGRRRHGAFSSLPADGLHHNTAPGPQRERAAVDQIHEQLRPEELALPRHGVRRVGGRAGRPVGAAVAGRLRAGGEDA